MTGYLARQILLGPARGTDGWRCCPGWSTRRGSRRRRVPAGCVHAGASRPPLSSDVSRFSCVLRSTPEYDQETVPERRDVDDGDAFHPAEAQKVVVSGNELVGRPGDSAVQELVVVGISACRITWMASRASPADGAGPAGRVPRGQ